MQSLLLRLVGNKIAICDVAQQIKHWRFDDNDECDLIQSHRVFQQERILGVLGIDKLF